MPRLGEILIERGALSADGLRSGLEACRRAGGRLGTWLVRLGLINETTLLEALSQQSGCPAAMTLELATVPSEVRASLPANFAKRNLVVAFNRHGRNLDVAMANPNDLLLIDEIAKLTGLVPRPHVATEAALAAALAIPGRVPGESSSAPPPGPPRGNVREWRQFWKLESSISELARGLEAARLPVPQSSAATFPHLAPVGVIAQAVEAIEGVNLAEALSLANHRDQVAALVLDFLAPHGERVALFSIHQGKVMGWAARGPNVVEEDFHTLILPLDRPSLFLNLSSEGVRVHIGPLGGGEGNDLLLDALGPPVPREAVVAPVKVRGKTAGCAWLDRGDEGVAQVPVGVVQEAARLAGLALEILVLRQKLKAVTREEEPRPPAVEA